MIEILVFGDMQQTQILRKNLRRKVRLEYLDEYGFSKAEKASKGVWASSYRGVEVFRRRHLPQDVSQDLYR